MSGFAYPLPLAAWPGYTNTPVACSSCVPPRRITSGRWLRIINLIPISYAFRPRLRPRLTLGGFAFPRKPWASDGQASHLPRATYSGILTSASSTLASALGFSLPQNAPLPLQLSLQPDASVCGFSPEYFRRPAARPVSCYALFKGMAASKPTSWLSSRLNILLTLSHSFGTLAVGLGCSPLDHGPYRSWSDSQA